MFTNDLIAVTELRTILSLAIAELKRGCALQAIYTFDDWHQHDGFVTEREMTAWGALEALLHDDEALIASRQGDSYVHCAFYSEDFSFLLRFDVAEDEPGGATGFSGRCDLSAGPRIIADIVSLVPLKLASQVRIEPSRAYFVRTYAG